MRKLKAAPPPADSLSKYAQNECSGQSTPSLDWRFLSSRRLSGGLLLQESSGDLKGTTRNGDTLLTGHPQGALRGKEFLPSAMDGSAWTPKCLLPLKGGTGAEGGKLALNSRKPHTPFQTWMCK